MSKFKKGDPFPSFDALINWLHLSGWVYINHKPYHPLWIKNMSISGLERFLGTKAMVRAIPNK
jgi:hypothetical protein